MVKARRLGLLEEVQLQVADPEPDHGDAERRRREPLHPEELLVEASRRLEIESGDADVVESESAHPGES